MDVTVIICCFNSASRLSPTLEHLAKQKLQGLNCELLLVDNNCIDNTVDLAVKVWTENESPFPLKVVEESNPGLSNARKAGVLAAKGEIILFCDDDNWLDQNYLKLAFEIVTNNRDIGVLGGRSIAVFEGEEPVWFSTYQSAFAVGVQSLTSGDISSRKYLWGAGAVVRKSVMIRFYEAGFRNYCTGRVKEALLSGDDSEICRWHLLVDLKLWYDERLFFKHYISKSRLTKVYLEELITGFTYSNEFLKKYERILLFTRKKFFVKTLLFDCILLLCRKIKLNEFANRITLNTNIIFPKADKQIVEILNHRKKYFELLIENTYNIEKSSRDTNDLH